MSHLDSSGYIMWHETTRHPATAGEAPPASYPALGAGELRVGRCSMDCCLQELCGAMARCIQTPRDTWPSCQRHPRTPAPHVGEPKGTAGKVSSPRSAGSRIFHRPVDAGAYSGTHREVVSHCLPSQPCVAVVTEHGVELSEAGTPCPPEGRTGDCTLETSALVRDKKTARRGAHLVFPDESGFLLVPNVKRTWAPRGKTPHFYHWFRQDRISAVAALSLSPHQRHMALYIRFHTRNLKGGDIKNFLRQLLRHLRGPVMLLWDRGMIHRDRQVQTYLKRYTRVETEFFPAYAPELNPAEFIWSQTDSALSNIPARDIPHFYVFLRSATNKLRRSQRLLRSCLHASGLTWKRS
jgi:transposase